MTITLLLDLDGTLLDNDIDTFLPNYLKAFSELAADFMDPNVFVSSLLAGTQAMVHNRLPDCTLQEVFNSVFFPLASADPKNFEGFADYFYTHVFPDLRRFTEPIPAAQDLVQQAVNRGFRLGVTTNPLFPRAAILHRLEWAGLPAADYPYNLITSYESFHFAKPDPAYFAEVMGRLGWPGGAVVMLGNDPERDIKPAHELGLAVYQINSEPELTRNARKPAIGGGSHAGFFPWVDSTPVESLQPDFSTQSTWLATLRATPAVIDSYSRLLPHEIWTSRPGLTEWSFTEILCHLRDVDLEVNLPRLRNVIETANPFIPGQDTDRWAEQRSYNQQDGRQAFHQFVAARMKLVALLDSLSPKDWQRPARHAIFGPTRLQELVDITASHDRLHLQQVRRLLEIIAPAVLL